MKIVETKLIPFIDAQQMIEVDRAMIEDFNISLIQMMENAGRQLANIARQHFFNGNPVAKRVVILAGSGGNGGGALVAARYLHNWGVDVSVYLGQSVEKMTSVAGQQLDSLKRLGVDYYLSIPAQSDLDKTMDLIIDGLIGYNLKGAPRKKIAELILWANEKNCPTLALDVPSGVDATTGKVYQSAIEADATLTLALPKKGLKANTANKNVGELYLADIGVPPQLYSRAPLNIDVPMLFEHEDLLRI